MATKYFSLGDWIEQGLFEVSYENLADGMTKQLNETFSDFMSRILVHWGSVKNVTQDQVNVTQNDEQVTDRAGTGPNQSLIRKQDKVRDADTEAFDKTVSYGSLSL